ncbi:MAG: hypothetical protein LLG00_10025 [Planctomycetaceae bacterium]|nr:hypothetical protein [Planctomycetaceae bacterium]
MATIAELEAHYYAHADSEHGIRMMVQNREFPAVFGACTASFEHIIPAIRFRKKRGITPEMPTLLAFTTICKYAPPLFEHAAIDSLEEFVRSSRILAQHEDDYLSTIDVARRRESIAHDVWNHLEKCPGALQRNLRMELGVVQEDAAEIVGLWAALGVIDRCPKDRSYALWFRTRLDVEIQGRCPRCGARGTGRKELFLKATTCKRCGTDGYYHIEYGCKH